MRSGQPTRSGGAVWRRGCTDAEDGALMKERVVAVNDKTQKGYSYVLTEPMGKNFDSDFKPELTPKQMLNLGVFGGKYMTDAVNEFPRDWFAEAKLSPYRHDPSLNYFGVSASQPLSVWRKKGWDLPRRSAGLVSVVLSLLLWAPYTWGRCTADQTMEGDAASSSPASKELRTPRSTLSTTATTSVAPVGV